MIIGLVAVLAAIVYKVQGARQAAREPTRQLSRSSGPLDVHLDLPPGTRVVSTALEGDRALLEVAEPGDGFSGLVLVDLTTGQVLRRIALGPNAGSDPGASPRQH
jgi:hypothetical protein